MESQDFKSDHGGTHRNNPWCWWTQPVAGIDDEVPILGMLRGRRALVEIIDSHFTSFPTLSIVSLRSRKKLNRG